MWSTRVIVPDDATFLAIEISKLLPSSQLGPKEYDVVSEGCYEGVEWEVSQSKSYSHYRSVSLVG